MEQLEDRAVPTATVVVGLSGPSSMMAGGQISYTLNVSNMGPDAAQNIDLTDQLPAGVSFVSQVQTDGPDFSQGYSGGQVSDSVAVLPADTSASFSVFVSVPLNTPNNTSLVDQAGVTTTTQLSGSSITSASVTTIVQNTGQNGADLAVVQSGPAMSAPGTDAVFTLTVTNYGPGTAQNITVSDALPSGLLFSEQTQTSGPTFTLDNSGGSPTATIATLPAGASATFSVDAEVDPNSAGGTVLSATATVSSSTTDPNSGNNNASASLTVSPEPPTVYAGPSQTVHAGATVTFDGSVTDPEGPGNVASIQWDFNYDGSNFVANPSANGSLTPTYSYTTPGSYLVALQATDAEGQSALDVTSVTVENAGALLVNAGPDQDATTGAAVTFAGNYSDPSGTVSSGGIAWDFNYDGSTFAPNPAGAGTLTPTYTYTAPGTYSAALRVTDSNGVNDISVLTVTVAYVGPTATAGPDQTVNEGGTATFSGSYTDTDGTVSSSGIAWDFNYDGSTFNADVTGTLTPSFQFLNAGQQEVALQITDGNGLTSLSVLNMTVNAVNPTVSAGSNVTTTVGSTVPFAGSFTDPGGTAGASFAWDFNYNGSTFNPGGADALNPVHTFTAPGTYTVALQVTDAQGNSGLGTLTVTVNSSSPVVVANAGPDQSAAAGAAVSFAGSYTVPPQALLPVSVDWDFNYDGSHFVADPSASNNPTPSNQFTTPGTYLVAFRVTTGDGEVGIGTAYLSVASSLNAAAGPDQTATVGDTVSFQGSATDSDGSNAITSIQWDFNYDGSNFVADPSANGTLTPSHQFSTIGDYTVALQVTDSFGQTSLSTLDVSVGGTVANTTVTVTSPVPEGAPVTFTVSNLALADPTTDLDVAADWTGSGQFQPVDNSELTFNSNGSVSFSHVYDDSSPPGGYSAIIQVTDLVTGEVIDLTQAVVVTGGSLSAQFGPQGGGSSVGPGVPIEFTDVTDPSPDGMANGLTYYYSINGGPLTSSSSPSFLLPDYTPGLTYNLSGHVADSAGSVSPTYTTTVTTVSGDVRVSNSGNGFILLNWNGASGPVTVGPNVTYDLGGNVSGLTVTLETSGATYDLETNGSFDTVNAAAGVGGVNLTLHTDISTGLPAFVGDGHIGTVTVPGINGTSGPSVVSVFARGDLGSITGTTGVSAAELVFGNLTGSITSLDHIETIQASGWLGSGTGSVVSVNHGIDQLTAYGVGASVTADGDYETSDGTTSLNVGDGGVPGILNVGNLGDSQVGGNINQFFAQFVSGNFSLTDSTATVDRLTLLAASLAANVNIQ